MPDRPLGSIEAPGAAWLPKRFRALEEISRSDVEIQLRARDELLDREVVICRPIPGASGFEGNAEERAKERDRSMRQARALARVHHAGIVRLLDVQETGDGPLLVMEPLTGETLDEILTREGRLAPERVRELAVKVCEALEVVHAAGIVHRGISRGNIVLRGDGSPCLTGFLFAKFAPGGSIAPGTTFEYRAKGGNPEGKIARAVAPPHPAPEQILGHAADARSDLFGLGWVLYECLTGESPYPLDHAFERWPAPTDPRRLAPAMSKAFAETILRCLNPSPLKRLGSAREVREALVSSSASAPAGSTTSSRRKVYAAFGALALVAGFFLYRASRSGSAEVDAAAGSSRGVPAKGVDDPGAGHGNATYSDRYDRSLALLIGIGEVYAKNRFPPLANAERDVTAIADRLKSIRSANERWSVDVLEGTAATHDNILTRLRSITDEAKTDDKIFLYYAGHGVRDEVSDKSGWIIPADGVPKDADPSCKSWIRFDEFGHLFDESKAKHVLVAMDCCYGGRMIASRSASTALYSRRFVTESAKLIISSGRPNEQVSDGVRGENSPFARAFLGVLSRTDVEAVTTADIYGSILKTFLDEEVSHSPVRGNPPSASQAGEVVFFLK